MKYGELNLGQIEAIVNKLGGMDGVKRFLSGQTIVRAVERRAFEIWKTITVGSGPRTAKEFQKAIKKAGSKISDSGNAILGHKDFTVSSEETAIDLVKVTARDLGFNQGATRSEIYAMARQLGLEILPPEAGPALRLAYQDQPMDEWIAIGMEPIINTQCMLTLFGVGRDGDVLLLDSHLGFSDALWDPDRAWVFGRRK